MLENYAKICQTNSTFPIEYESFYIWHENLHAFLWALESQLAECLSKLNLFRTQFLDKIHTFCVSTNKFFNNSYGIRDNERTNFRTCRIVIINSFLNQTSSCYVCKRYHLAESVIRWNIIDFMLPSFQNTTWSIKLTRWLAFISRFTSCTDGGIACYTFRFSGLLNCVFGL
jgi:hypothetical protein